MTTGNKGRNRWHGATPNEADHGGNSTHFGKPVYTSDMTSDLHRVGGGYSVQFFIRNGMGGSPRFDVIWSPDMPGARDMRRRVDLARYRQARHVFLQEVSRRIGGAVLCVELDGSDEA